MAQIKSQMKRIETNEKDRQRNVSVRSEIATATKKVRVAVAAKEAEKAQELLKKALRLIDKSVTSGVYARNTAARKKAELQRLVGSLK